MDAANQITLDKMEAEELSIAQEVPKENKIGSYERLMGGFGSEHPQ